jgi:hypothetical protein
MKYAIVNQTGAVVNSIELENPADWKAPEGCTVVPHEHACVGWTTVDGVLTAPPVVVMPMLPTQQIVALEVNNLLPRPLRDLLLKDPTAPSYAKVKVLDDQIAALRAQLVKE